MPVLTRSETAARSGERHAWDELAARSNPAWYLDPEVALQKRRVHQRLIRKWLGIRPPGLVLKTDLFEDAWGLDTIVFDVFDQGGATLVGTDIALATVKRAQARAGAEPLHGFVCDVRRLPIARDSLDAILSISTLDHFGSRAEFGCALSELCAALKPGASLVITLDNPLNPWYPALRLAAGAGLAPFRLGYSPASGALIRELGWRGFDILDVEWLIHNPRGVSTALFRLMRRAMGRRAGSSIRRVLDLFALQDRLWSRRFTACFYAIHARKQSRRRHVDRELSPPLTG